MNDNQKEKLEALAGKPLEEIPEFVPQPPDPRPEVPVSPEFDLDDDQQIAHAVEMIDSRIWAAIEIMPPHLADKFFAELRKCVDDVEEVYWEDLDDE